MKLMSQLSASPVCYDKDGLVSKRNKFVKKNFRLLCSQWCWLKSYENVRLRREHHFLLLRKWSDMTGSITDLGGLVSEPSANISRVFIASFQEENEGKLEIYASSIQE